MTFIIPGRILTAAGLNAAIEEAVAAAVADSGGGTATPTTIVPRRLVATQGAQAFYSWFDDPPPTDNQTFHDLRTTIGASGWVRHILFRDRSGGACSVAGMLIAQTASEASPINPVDEAGAAVSWIPVTFNNGGADISLLDQLHTHLTTSVTPVYTLAMNAPPLNSVAFGGSVPAEYRKVNGWTFTDWMHAAPYRRTDSGSLPLLMTRTKFSGDVTLGSAIGTTYDAAANGRFVKSYVNAGDCITTPANFVSTVRTTKAAGLFLQYIPQSPVVQVCVTGDSTLNPVLNHISLACFELSTAGVPIEFCSTAKGGLAAAEYADQFRPLLRTINPSIMFLETWSPNAGTSLSSTELGWAKNMQIAADVLAAGGVPVLMTPFPCPGRITTTAQEAIRLMIRDRCFAAQAAGMKVLDLDGLMSAGGSIAAIKPEYSGDGVHPTEDGQELMKELLTKPFLEELLGL